MSRLLLFNTDLELGGTPEVLRQVERQLRAAGHRVEVACLGRHGPVAEQIVDQGGTVTAFDRRARGVFDAVGDLHELIDDHGVTHVLSFLVHANVVAHLAAKRRPRVRWFQSVQTTQPYPRWHWWLQRFVHRRAERVICPSQSVADHAMAASGIPATKLTVIPNGVERVAESVSVSGTLPLRVGFLGRLDPVKRVHLLIESTRDLPGVTLDVFGDGPDRARLELLGHGRFHGMVPRDDALARLDVLVLPSLAEGMPMVLLEAMAAGVVVVAFDVPGCRDVVRDGENGVLTTPTELRSVLAELRDDAGRRERLAGGGRATAEGYRWRSIAGRYAAVLGL
ncbi:MAG: glycosyltransferase family 4 protein [Planctomycetota bacterium]